MGKIITILGGCLVVAGGVGYGVTAYRNGCELSHGCGAKVSAPAACCDESDACPLSAVGTSAGDEASCCPLATALKATSPVSASADDGCCSSAAAKCPAPAGADAGLQAVAGVALAAGGK